MRNQLILQLFSTFSPIVADVIQRYMAKNNGRVPNAEEMRVEFESNIDKYLDEGATWKASHPRA